MYEASDLLTFSLILAIVPLLIVAILVGMEWQLAVVLISIY